jgi:hypothetical protein
MGARVIMPQTILCDEIICNDILNKYMAEHLLNKASNCKGFNQKIAKSL